VFEEVLHEVLLLDAYAGNGEGVCVLVVGVSFGFLFSNGCEKFGDAVENEDRGDVSTCI